MLVTSIVLVVASTKVLPDKSCQPPIKGKYTIQIDS